MTDEERTRLDAMPPLQRSVTGILATLLDLHSPPAAIDKTVNLQLGVEACLMVAAGLIEVDSRNQTARDLAGSTHGAAEVLGRMVQGLRADFEKTGMHGLEQMGATGMRRTNDR